MLFQLPSILLVLAAHLTSACSDHSNFGPVPRYKPRQASASPPRNWAYESSFNWGKISPEYYLCQAGTQQAPIALSLGQGVSTRHRLDFSGYTGNFSGNFYNWDFGPAFTLHRNSEKDYTKNPRLVFDNETVYLVGWHIHSPADHSINGDRAKAEIHFVHYDAAGVEKAVLGVVIDPGIDELPWWGAMPSMIGFNETQRQVANTLDLDALALENYFHDFWTYKGSLTSPPCKEGIRWFVGRSFMYLGNEQMSKLLAASTYSARTEQEVWMHEINV